MLNMTLFISYLIVMCWQTEWQLATCTFLPLSWCIGFSVFIPDYLIESWTNTGNFSSSQWCPFNLILWKCQFVRARQKCGDLSSFGQFGNEFVLSAIVLVWNMHVSILDSLKAAGHGWISHVVWTKMCSKSWHNVDFVVTIFDSMNFALLDRNCDHCSFGLMLFIGFGLGLLLSCLDLFIQNENYIRTHQWQWLMLKFMQMMGMEDPVLLTYEE